MMRVLLVLVVTTLACAFWSAIPIVHERSVRKVVVVDVEAGLRAEVSALKKELAKKQLTEPPEKMPYVDD